MYFLICLGFLIINFYIQPYLSLSSVTSLQKGLIQDDVPIQKTYLVLVQKMEKVGNNLTPKESWFWVCFFLIKGSIAGVCYSKREF